MSERSSSSNTGSKEGTAVVVVPFFVLRERVTDADLVEPILVFRVDASGDLVPADAFDGRAE